MNNTRAFFNMGSARLGRAALFLFAAAFFSTGHVFAATWQLQNSGVSSDLFSVFFVDFNTGWVVGASGTLLKTTDAGATWTPQATGTASALRDIKFTGNIGIAVGVGGTIIKSSDTGNTWYSLTSGVTDNLYSVFMLDSNNYWTVGQSGRVLTTIDGGASWSSGDPSANVPSTNLRSVFFVSASTGWVAGDSDVLYMTQSTGTSWSPQTAGIITQNLRDLFFVSASTGWVVGTGGALFYTGDSGNTWASRISTTADINSVFFISTGTGWTVGASELILKTTDSGHTFMQQASTVTYDLNKVFFLSDGFGFAVGNAGAIMSFSTGAVTGSASPLQAPPQGSLKAIDNLFDPSKGEKTTLQYSMLNDGRVIIRIFTMQGRLVRTLVDEDKAAGAYTVQWDGKNGSGENAASGIYMAHIKAPLFSTIQKIAVVQ